MITVEQAAVALTLVGAVAVLLWGLFRPWKK